MCKKPIYDSEWGKILIYGMMLVALMLIIVAAATFITNFKNTSISEQLVHWGQFGDYFGGVLNPLLALINICVFIMLTFAIQRMNDQRSKKDLATQQIIALFSIKQDEAKSFIREMDLLLSSYANSKLDENAKLTRLAAHFSNFEDRSSDLFPGLFNSSEAIALNNDLKYSLKDTSQNNSTESLKNKFRIMSSYSTFVKELRKYVIEIIVDPK